MSEKNNFGYAKKTTTAIYHEKPSRNNPFVAEIVHLYGYNLLELTKKKSFIEVLLLLYTGELPPPKSVELMNALMIGLINPGPRAPSVRAAMTAGVSKSNTSHLLPIGLMVLGGNDGGASEVENSMKFISNSKNLEIDLVLKLQDLDLKTSEGEIKAAPGFGSSYGQQCIITNLLAEYLVSLEGAGNYLKLMHKIMKGSSNNPNIGWLPVGLAAAVFLDLGIKPREGIALFQLICSPGISVQALEQTHKPLSSMPFLEDDQYELK